MKSMREKERVLNVSRRSFLKMAGLATGAMLVDPLLSMGGWADRPAGTLRQGGRPLKIGVLLSASNVYPAMGESLIAGMRLFFDQVGAQNHGREIELVTEEIGFGSGAFSSRKLIQQDKVDLVVGALSSEASALLRQLFEEHRTPLIVANVGANVVREADRNPYVFHNSLNYWQANWALGAWAGAHLGRRAFVATSLYDSGYDALHAFRLGFESAGGEIVQTSVTHASPEADDLDALSATIKRVGPDFVFASYCGAPAADLIRAFAGSGLAKQFPLVSSGFMVEDADLPHLGQAALGVKSVLPWAQSLDTVENKAFTAAFERRTGRPANPFGVLGFDTARLILTAVDGISDGEGRGTELRHALGSAEFASPRGPLKMNPITGSASSPLYLREVRGHVGGLANAVIAELDPVSDLEAGDKLNQGSPKTGWLNAYLSV